MRIAGIMIAVALIAAAAWGISIAAEPGSKSDPLATVGYVQRYAQFTSQRQPAGESIRLAQGAEFVIVGTQVMSIGTTKFNPLHDDLADLSAGNPARNQALLPYHHYVNASNHDIFIAFDTEVELLLRGEWK